MSDFHLYTPWISDSGSASPDEGRSLVDAFLKNHPECRFISFHSDCFSAGFPDTAVTELSESLLELRLFDASAELRLFRTSLASDFQYRIADDETLKSNLAKLDTSDVFLKDPEHYRYPVRQVLDIDTSATAYQKKEKDAHGCRILRTVGGGTYALPLLGEENTALVIDYLSYDPVTGVCSTVDDRIADFEKWEGGKADG